MRVNIFSRVISWHQLKVYIPMAFNSYVHPWNHHRIKIQHTSSPTKGFHTHELSIVPSTLAQDRNHCRLVCVWQKWNQIQCTFWCPASFTQNNDFEIYLSMYISRYQQVILFYCWVVHTYLRAIAGLILDHPKKVSQYSESHQFFGFPVHMKVTFTLFCSLLMWKSIMTKKQCAYLN